MRNVARTARLMGNHEQMFLLAAQGNWRSNKANQLYLQAGVHPCISTTEFLSLPTDSLPQNELHWAWIEAQFLTWRAGFGGKIVIHGHTPPRKHRELTLQNGPHALCYDRLGLDGGSAETGIVTGAQIEDGRYRVFQAGYNVRPHARLPLRDRFLNS